MAASAVAASPAEAATFAGMAAAACTGGMLAMACPVRYASDPGAVGLAPRIPDNKSLAGAAAGNIDSLPCALVAATVSDVVVIRFMRSFSVSDIAERTFRYATQTTVALLFIVILTFVGLYLPDVVILKQAPAVLAQGVAVLLVSINAAFLNLFVSPYLYDMVAKKTVSISRARTLRRFAFALAAISFVSWYSAFALALYRTLDYEISTLLLGYSVATFAAVLIGLIFESVSCGRRASV